jgi:histidine triad (HIT) family protein
MLPKEQIPQIREQLIEHIKKNLPLERRELAIKQIKSLTDEQLEGFLIQNKMIKSPEETPADRASEPSTPLPHSPKAKCLFCEIIQEKIPFYKIDENKEAIAILEINPISKGHVLLIPKKHLDSQEKLPKTIFTLSKKISKKIKSKFQPQEIKIYSSNIFGHEILNLLPIYENEIPESERLKVTPEELQETQKVLKAIPRKKPLEKPKRKTKKSQKKPSKEKEKKLWIPRRIP